MFKDQIEKNDFNSFLNVLLSGVGTGFSPTEWVPIPTRVVVGIISD